MLDQLILQVATTPPPPTQTSDSIVNLIYAVTFLISTVLSIAIAIIGKIAINAKGKVKEVADTTVKVSEFALEGAKELVNNQDKIKGIAAVLRSMAPEEARKALLAANITIEQLTDDVVKTTENLNKLGENLPIEVNIDANHNGIPDRIEPIPIVTKPAAPTAGESVAKLDRAVDNLEKKKE